MKGFDGNWFKLIWLPALATVAALSATSLPALAQTNFPNKPIRMVVPFPPGGVSDGSARLVAIYMGQRLGQQVLVENRPGASGNISGQYLAQSGSDGYTILLGYNGLLTINPYVIARMPFDTVKDLAPVGRIGDYPSVLSAHPGAGIKSIADLLARSKAGSDTISYGTSGPGSVEHLIAVMFSMRSGAKMTHVPYKGAGPALADAIAGHIPLALTSVAGGRPHVQSGKLIGLAVSSAERTPALPDIPTFIESGVSDLVMTSWIGLFAPGQTPKPIIERLNRELNAVLKTSELRERLNGLGINVTPGTPEQLADEILRDLQTNALLVKAAGLTAQ